MYILGNNVALKLQSLSHKWNPQKKQFQIIEIYYAG